MPGPSVSVVMAAYNGADHIDAAIASVLAQTQAALDLIVVDDGSADATASAVEDWARRDGRVRLLRRDHAGHALALNAGIAAADGDFIARIDHDDVWRPQKLSLQLAWMARHEVDVCGAWVRRIGEASGTIRFAQGHAAIRADTLFTCPMLDSATVFRGDVLRANPYPPEAFVRQELAQCLRLLPAHRFANLPRVLCDYRFHAGQKTRRFAPMIRYRHAQLRRQAFTDQFPDAPTEDVAAFAELAMVGDAPVDLGQLRAASRLFLRYLRFTDKEARLRMRRRWKRLCQGAACCDPGLADLRQSTLDHL
ncbi:MAG TPA: glycosyltransferase family 2 protein [Caulobacteraceae bacterium]|nr:glycosyltransferase family 2 protein [Caulobacteraceae bacterium]